MSAPIEDSAIHDGLKDKKAHDKVNVALTAAADALSALPGVPRIDVMRAEVNETAIVLWLRDGTEKEGHDDQRKA